MNSFAQGVRKTLIIMTPVILLFSSDFVLTQRAFADEPMQTGESEAEIKPTLPDVSHQYLGSHAAESHGNSPDQISWIAQGAYDEDHQPFPMFGWHSWDPDTGDFWWTPIVKGQALERANTLFWEAVRLHRSDVQGSWHKLEQSLHMVQDISTPAHAHADAHICINYRIGDCDAYESWLGINDHLNTFT